MPAATQTRARGKDPVESDLDLTLLRNQPILGEIGTDRVRRLCACATVRKARASAVSFTKRSRACLFAVRKGSLVISVPAIDGRGAVFNVLREGEIFGEIALLAATWPGPTQFAFQQSDAVGPPAEENPTSISGRAVKTGGVQCPPVLIEQRHPVPSLRTPQLRSRVRRRDGG